MSFAPQEIAAAILGPEWQQRIGGIVASKWFPAGLYAIAVIVLVVWIYNRFFSYFKSKADLRQAITDLNSDNIHLRMNAIEETIEISRRSRRLHYRAIQALCLYLQIRHPAPSEENRSVILKKQRYGPPHAACNQQIIGNLHEFAQHQINLPREHIEADANAVIEALARRRRFFDDPRRWIDISFVNLPAANFEGMSFKKVSFVGANLRHARFDKAKLNRTVFSGAILNDAFFTAADARNADFSGVQAHRIHFDEGNISNAKFLGADLYDLSIQKAKARKTCFMGAQMWRASGGLTDFKGAIFASARLEGADLHAAKNLSRSQITGLMGADTDKNTRLPWSTEEELKESGLFRG